MSNIHANQPHIHLQKHSIKHDSHQYEVEVARPQVARKKLQIFAGHKLLWSLLSVFIVLSLVLAGIHILPTVISNYNSAVLEKPSTITSEVSAAKPYRNMLLYSTPFGLHAYNPERKEVEQITDQALVSLIHSTTRILRNQSGELVFLFSPTQASASILNFTTESTIPFGQQLSDRFEQPQIRDVVWHPQRPTLYLLISALEINFRQFFLVSYDLTTSQLQFTKIAPAANPTLSWINPSTQSVYVHSLLPTGLSQIDEVTAHQAPKTTSLPLRVFGQANEVGFTLASVDDRVGVTTIFDPVSRFSALPIDPTNPSIQLGIWRPDESGISVVTGSAQSPTITSFSAGASVICSTSTGRIDSMHGQNGLRYLTTSNTDISIIDLQTCASSSLPSQSSITSTKINGWL